MTLLTVYHTVKISFAVSRNLQNAKNHFIEAKIYEKYHGYGLFNTIL